MSYYSLVTDFYNFFSFLDSLDSAASEDKGLQIFYISQYQYLSIRFNEESKMRYYAYYIYTKKVSYISSSVLVISCVDSTIKVIALTLNYIKYRQTQLTVNKLKSI